MPKKPKKLLIIGQDRLAPSDQNVRIDHLATRPSYVPGAPRSNLKLRQIPLVFLRIVSGYYDLIVLPGFRLDFRRNASAQQKFLRKALGLGAVQRLVGFFIKGRRIVILDKDDDPQIARWLIDLTKPDIYFKANLRYADIDNNRDIKIKHLPYYISDATLEHCSKTKPHKDIDVCCMLSLHSEHRKQAVEFTRRLASDRSLSIYISEKMLAPDLYYGVMQRSKCCISPSGIGWHCYRHIESLACGAIPVVNKPKDDLITNLVDGKHILLYQNYDEFQSRIYKYIHSFDGRPADFYTFVTQNHSFSSIGDLILREFDRCLKGQ